MKIDLKFEGMMDVKKVDFTTALDDGSVIARVKMSFLIDKDLCTVLFGCQFAESAFAKDADDNFVYERLTPSIKMDPHQVQYGNFIPGSTKPAIDRFEPVSKDDGEGLRVTMTVPTMFKADDEAMVLYMVRKLGHDVQVKFEPSQMDLPFEDDSEKKATQIGISVNGKDFVNVGTVDEFAEKSKAIVEKAKAKRKKRAKDGAEA